MKKIFYVMQSTSKTENLKLKAVKELFGNNTINFRTFILEMSAI